MTPDTSERVPRRSITRDEGKPGAVICAHCGLPVPSGWIRADQTNQFCCQGCESAWQIIHDCGLEAWYEMQDPASRQQASGRERSSVIETDDFDRPEFHERYVSHAGELASITLRLQGIHCAACIWLVEKLPRVVPGVVRAVVNWSRKTVFVEWQPERVPLSRIAAALIRLGYPPQPAEAVSLANQRQQENRRQLIQIGIAGAAAGNNMLIAASLYLGACGAEATLFRWTSCLVGLVSLLGPGRVFLKGAVAALRTRTPHMDLPIGVALVVGATTGVANTIRGIGDIYFDSLSVLVFLLLVGRWIQAGQQNRANDAVEMMYRLTPRRARRRTADGFEDVAADSLVAGDEIEVLPGDLVPCDGIVQSGRSAVDEQILTGESIPVERQTGEPLFAGTRNVSGQLIARVTASGDQTRIRGISRLVEQAGQQRPAIVEWANRIGGYFVVIVISLAVATFLMWMSEDVMVAVDRMVALLVVACPCALALATPLALSMSLGRLARDGILVKSGDVLQRLDSPGVLWLDKTGTVTEGRLHVAQWEGDASVLAAVAAVESRSRHPVARALVEFGTSEGGGPEESSEVTHFEAFADGVEAEFAGSRLRIGNRTFMLENQVRLNEPFERAAEAMLAAGLSPCWIAGDDCVVAVAGVGDRVRDDITTPLVELQRSGWSVGLLSGDHQTIVSGVAEQLGLDRELALGGVSPEAKLEVVRSWSERGQTVVMVGDGVNDSAALAAASVGVAVHGGAEVSLAAAPVYLSRAGLHPLVQLMTASRRTNATIRWGLMVSLAYNVVGVTLAMLGWINPLVAALVMPVSSLTVIAISMR